MYESKMNALAGEKQRDLARGELVANSKIVVDFDRHGAVECTVIRIVGLGQTPLAVPRQ